MKRKIFSLFVAVFMSLGVSVAGATPIIELDSHQTDFGAGIITANSFNTTTGLGSITVKYTAGTGYVSGLFVDHEINQESAGLWFDEYGTKTGNASGLSWEIDEPKYLLGNILTNFGNRSLDNTNSILDSSPDDVSMALMWNNFDVAAGKYRLVTFTIGIDAPTAPTGIDPFYLAQFDSYDPDAHIYFSSSLSDEFDVDTNPVPEPSTMLLLGAGLAGLGIYGRRRNRK